MGAWWWWRATGSRFDPSSHANSLSMDSTRLLWSLAVCGPLLAAPRKSRTCVEPHLVPVLVSNPQIVDGVGGMMGCEVFGDACFETCEGDNWTNWYAAHRTTPV